MLRTLEQSTMRKVYLRLLPFAVLSYVLAYIDRINVSFAGLRLKDGWSILTALGNHVPLLLCTFSVTIRVLLAE